MAILEYDLSCPPHLLPLFAVSCKPLRELVERVTIGKNHRPDEPEYWIAYVYDNQGKRHGLGTPGTGTSLAVQSAELCRQLRELADLLATS